MVQGRPQLSTWALLRICQPRGHTHTHVTVLGYPRAITRLTGL